MHSDINIPFSQPIHTLKRLSVELHIEDSKKSQVEMRARLSKQKSAISINEFLMILKLECDTNCIYKRAAMFVLPIFVKNVQATTHDSDMSTAVQITSDIALACTAEPLIRINVLQS